MRRSHAANEIGYRVVFRLAVGAEAAETPLDASPFFLDAPLVGGSAAPSLSEFQLQSFLHSLLRLLCSVSRPVACEALGQVGGPTEIVLAPSSGSAREVE